VGTIMVVMGPPLILPVDLFGLGDFRSVLSGAGSV
jgi:hypothetical protein